MLYIVDSSATDRVSFAEFVATIRAALCVLPISHRDQYFSLHMLCHLLISVRGRPECTASSSPVPTLSFAPACAIRCLA